MPAAAPPASDLECRILDAALVLVARWGVAKTSLADIAQEARCGRATVYRTFPGGKAQVFTALAHREIRTFQARLTRQLDEAASLEDALVSAIEESAAWVGGHEALQFILAHEPGLVLPYLGFNQVDRLYAAAARFAGPHLVRFVDVEQAPWAVEWVVRLVTSYLFAPAEGVNLADREDVRRLVRTYLLPALAPTRGTEGDPSHHHEPVPVTSGS